MKLLVSRAASTQNNQSLDKATAIAETTTAVTLIIIIDNTGD